MSSPNKHACCLDFSEEDVLTAMQALPGHIDITPGDFQEIYQLAYLAAVERLAKRTQAKEIMTHPVHQVRLETDLLEIATLLADKNISGVPVVDELGKIVGVVSEKDIFHRMGARKTGSFMEVVAHCLKSKGCVAAALEKLTAADIMSTPAITASADIAAADIADLFTNNQINRLPIIAADGRIIGIVTRSDLVTSICELK